MVFRIEAVFKSVAVERLGTARNVCTLAGWHVDTLGGRFRGSVGCMAAGYEEDSLNSL